MATSDPRDADDFLEEKKPFDVIAIGPHMMKYINPAHKKVSYKIYDYKCDIKLTVDTSNFKAHKEVLSNASDYFSAMFSHDMVEKDQKAIVLQGISPAGFTIILDYFYHGHLTIEPHTAEDVLEAARFFQVGWLVDVCSNFLVKELSTENYQTVLQMADKYWLGDLRGDIFDFLGHNIVSLSKEKNFHASFDVELLQQFLKEDIFVNADEEFVFQLINKWVAANPDERKEYLLPLLRLVKFPLMDPDSLNALPKSILQWPEIEDAVEEAKFYHNNIPSQSLHLDRRFLSRGASPCVCMNLFKLDISAISYEDVITGAHCTEEFDSPEMESQFEFSSIAVLGNFMYMIGGYGYTVCSSNLVYRYNPGTHRWTQLASMNEPRVCHAVCASHDKIYAIGGNDHNIGELGDVDHILGSVEVYNVRGNHWEFLPNLPMGAYNNSAACHDTNVYVSGGISDDPFDSIPMSSMWCYNQDLRSWRQRSDMLYQRQGHSLTEYDNKLYVFGGHTCPDMAVSSDSSFRLCFASEVYDIETNQWTEIRPIPKTFGRVLNTVGVWDGIFYLFGGGNLHKYNVKEDRMEFGNFFGSVVQKIAILKVSFPID